MVSLIDKNQILTELPCTFRSSGELMSHDEPANRVQPETAPVDFNNLVSAGTAPAILAWTMQQTSSQSKGNSSESA